VSDAVIIAIAGLAAPVIVAIINGSNERKLLRLKEELKEKEDKEKDEDDN